jgi:serine phosphatase RsbU (regulator of sigma subunit)
MQTRRQRFDAFLAELPRFGLPTTLALLAASWGALVFYDLIIGDYSASTPFEFDLLRSIIPLAGFAPLFVRLLRPEDIDDDARAYETFVRMTSVAIGVVAATTFLRILPFSYTRDAIPESFWSFVVGRGISLVPLLGLPIIAEHLVRLLRYRSRRSVPVLATVFTYGLILSVVVAQLIPNADIPDFDLPTPAMALGPVLGFVALIISARLRWIVNLRKRQKLVILGLSACGMAVGGVLISLAGSSELSRALASTFIALPVFGYAIGIALANVGLAMFVHALIALPTAVAIDRRNTEVTSLATFGRLLTRSFDMNDLVETSIGVACDVTASRAAWIELEATGSRDLLLGATPRLEPDDALRLMSARVAAGLTLAESVRSRLGVQVVDHIAVARPAGAATQSRGEKSGRAVRPRRRSSERSKVEGHELSTVAAAPLRVGDAVLGTLYVAKERTKEFDREDLSILKTVADQIAMAMQHSRLIHSSMERELIEREMVIARDLQQRLLPRAMPESEWFDIYAESQPAFMVGGDYYDLVSFNDGTLGIVIADVSGKGPSAALYMGMIKGVIQALSGSTETPRDLLAKINLALHGHIDERWFATMTCAQVFEDQRTLRVARAGHCPTLGVRDGVGEYRRSRGIGLAIARPLLFERNLELEELHFSPDDYVVFLSDGLPEARSPEGEEFGYERLLATVTEGAARLPSPAELRNIIFNELSAFTRGELPVDDSTIVVLRWKGSAGSEAST